LSDLQESYKFDPDHDPNRDISVGSIWGEVPGAPHERLQTTDGDDNIIKYNIKFWPGFFTNNDNPHKAISNHIVAICNRVKAEYSLLDGGNQGIIIQFGDSMSPLEFVYSTSMRTDGISGKYPVSQLARAECKDKVYRFFFYFYFSADKLEVKDTQKIIKKQFQEYRSEIWKAKSYQINKVMKQPTGAEFDRAFKAYFDKLLKPFGFKRKIRAYYRVMNGQIIQAFHCYKHSRFDWTPRLSLMLLCDNSLDSFWLSHGNIELHDFDPRWTSGDINLRRQALTSYQFSGAGHGSSMEDTFDICADILTQHALPELDKICDYKSAFHSTKRYSDFSPQGDSYLAILYGGKPGDIKEIKRKITMIEEANIKCLESQGYKIRPK